MAAEKVRVYDLQTKQLTTIPAAELAPGMVRANVQGIEGDVWIDATTAGQAPLRHPPFPEEIREHFRRFAALFHDVYPITPEQWEDGFRRDTNPEKEIAVWLRIADAFEHFTEGRQLFQDQRKDIFDVLLSLATNGADHVLQTVSPRTLSRKRVKEMVDFLCGTGGPEDK